MRPASHMPDAAMMIAPDTVLSRIDFGNIADVMEAGMFEDIDAAGILEVRRMAGEHTGDAAGERRIDEHRDLRDPVRLAQHGKVEQ